MFRIIFLLLPFFGMGPNQHHRFEIKFYNSGDSCVRTINEAGIESIRWSNQSYSIKKRENLSELNIKGGRLGFFFDGIEVMRVKLFDYHSSGPIPNDPYVIATDGHFTGSNVTFFINSARPSKALSSFIADRRIRQYLIDQHVKIE